MTLEQQAQQLATYTRHLMAQGKFHIFVDASPEDYDSMAAIIIDAVLRGGIDYSVVQKYVLDFNGRYPDIKTVTQFGKLIHNHKSGVVDLIAFNNYEKGRRIAALTLFFHGEGVDTKDDLYEWLDNPTHCTELQDVRGIGPATVDFLKQLAGHIDDPAASQRITNFVHEAGIRLQKSGDYTEIRAIVKRAAELLITPGMYDSNIWHYMKNK